MHIIISQQKNKKYKGEKRKAILRISVLVLNLNVKMQLDVARKNSLQLLNYPYKALY